MILRFDSVSPAPIFKCSSEEWTNWTWQFRNSLTTEEEFGGVFDLMPEERAGLKRAGQIFKVASTPYYSSLALQQEACGQEISSQETFGRELGSLLTRSATLTPGPLRRILIPTAQETEPGEQQMEDPLDEHHYSPAKRIVHRYSDRLLFLVTDICSVYCRFCTRKRFTGQEQGFATSEEYAEGLQYIKSHPGIREVILSGGDPLTLSNGILRKILTDLRAIPHVELIRLGTRMPVVCPMRVDRELSEILRGRAPVYMMTHFSHPRELTAEAAEALTMLADHGIPLFNQMVLLNGVNNHPALIQALSRRLLYLRVKPYYMFQCDPSAGTDHLRTTVESSEAIIRELWGHLSGLAMPVLSLDIPGGGGKTSLVPDFMVSQKEGVREFVGWDGKRGVYRNPKNPEIVPTDAKDYVDEWEATKNAKLEADILRCGESLEKGSLTGTSPRKVSSRGDIIPETPQGSVTSTLSILMAFFAVLLTGMPAHAKPTAYLPDYSRSHIWIHTYKAGVLGFLGGEHGVEAQDITAAICADQDDLTSSKVKITLATASIKVDTAVARKGVGLGDKGGPDIKDREEIQQKMQGPKVLDVAKFPEIIFQSMSIKSDPGNPRERAFVSGNLTLREVTRGLETTAHLERVGETGLRLHGTFQIKLSDFGIEPPSAGGLVKVKDIIDVLFDLDTENSGKVCAP